MVYINQNSEIVNFPKVSNEMWNKIHFVNQTTKVSFDLFTSDLTDSSLFYSIDISSVLDNFEVGQYDYSFQKNDGTVICSGILQFDNFGTSSVEYEIKNTTIQYTPDETLYPQINKTINITENDTYDIENYDTAVVNVKGSGGMSGRIEVIKVNNTPYKSINVEANGEEKNSFNRLNADILFNLNCDAKTLYENKDKLYVTLSKYSNRRKKQAVINDVIKSDERLKVYCWVMNYNDDVSIDWTYFYTIDNFNDRPDDLFEYDPEVLVKRLPHCTERNQGSYNYNNNYATYLNELIYGGLYVSDLAGDYTEIERYPEGDIDKYFVGDISANPIAKWASEWWSDDEDLDELIYNEKPDFFDWLSNKCIIERGGDGDPQYCYTTYVGDYPIYPVKLADCRVIVWGDVLKEFFDPEHSGIQQYIKLSDLSLEQLEKLPQITLVLPFTTNHIVGRLYLPRHEYGFSYRNPEILDVGMYNDSNKIGGTKRWLNAGESNGGLKTYFKLGICNEEQLRTNNFRDIPQYDFKLLTYGNNNVMYWFDWDDEWRTAMITKVI